MIVGNPSNLGLDQVILLFFDHFSFRLRFNACLFIRCEIGSAGASSVGDRSESSVNRKRIVKKFCFVLMLQSNLWDFH